MSITKMWLCIQTLSAKEKKKTKNENHKSKLNSASFSIPIIFPFYSLSFSAPLCRLLFVMLTMVGRDQKLLRQQTQSKCKKEKTTVLEPEESMTLLSREAGEAQSVYLPISSLLFEPERMWCV